MTQQKTGFSREAYLRSLVYFDGLDDSTLAALAGQLQRRTYAAGEIIFFDGDPAAGLWIIERGRVKVFKLNPEGTEHVLRLFGDNDTFNDIGALDGGSNPANAGALSDCVIWMLPAQTLIDAVIHNPRLAHNVIRVLAARVRGLIGQMEDLALYSVTVRLARFLLKQLDDPALSGPGVTRTAIAAHLATTPQTISNVLRSLEESGAISFDRHRIFIEREDLLRTIAML